MSKDSLADGVFLKVWNKSDPFFFIGERFRWTPPGRFNPWRLEPSDKKESVHELPGTHQCLLAIFPNAIAVGSPVATAKTLAGWGGMMIAGSATVISIYMLVANLMERHPYYFMVFFSFITTLLFMLCFVWSYRRLFVALSDWPIVFNRKTRQITFLPSFMMPFLKFWKLPPQEWRTVSWDEVKARTYKHLETNAGKSFHNSYHLFLLWGGEAGDAHALRDYVSIGREGYFEDETLWMLWEHIRRYMEEGGSPILHGEELRPKTRGKPIIYPPELISAAGGPALSAEAIDKLAEEALSE